MLLEEAKNAQVPADIGTLKACSTLRRILLFRLFPHQIHLPTEALKATWPRSVQEIYDLFFEYENGTSSEAKFVKDLDKFELIVQATEYEKRKC